MLNTVFKSIKKTIVQTAQPSQSVNFPRSFQPGPRNCAVVMDCSPSMTAKDYPPTRLGAAQQAARSFVKRLSEEEPGSQVTIISYGGKSTLCCPLIPVKKSDVINQGINSIKTGAMTNITSGLELASTTLSSSKTISQVVLLTDGHHNWGRKPYGIANTLRKNIILDIVGIGGKPRDVDEKLLKTICSEYPDGQKRYRWIGDKENLVKHFETLAGGLSRNQ